jgi:hypothetical protein
MNYSEKCDDLLAIREIFNCFVFRFELFKYNVINHSFSANSILFIIKLLFFNKNQIICDKSEKAIEKQ